MNYLNSHYENKGLLGLGKGNLLGNIFDFSNYLEFCSNLKVLQIDARINENDSDAVSLGLS